MTIIYNNRGDEKTFISFLFCSCMQAITIFIKEKVGMIFREMKGHSFEDYSPTLPP